MKGSKHASDQLETEEQRLRDETLIFWGRQQSELEHYASQKALDPMALAARLGELWLHYSGHRDGERMPGLSPERHSVATRNGRPRDPALATEEGHHRSHDDGTSRGKRGRPKAKATVKPAAHQVDKRKNSWARFKTPQARSKEMLRRMMLRKDSMAKAMVKGLRGKQQGKPKRDPKKQALYKARHDAIQRGETPPPLPGQRTNVFGKPLPKEGQAA